MPILKSNSSYWRDLTRLALMLLAAGQLVWQPTLPVQAAAFLHAKPNGAIAGTCNSWATACDLQYALGQAAAGDEIWVAQGIYTPSTSVDASFVLTNGVMLYGGFAMTETARDQRNWVTNLTVLSGDIAGDDITDNGVVTDTYNIAGTNSYHVVSSTGVTNSAGLDGFTITAGQANAAAAPNNSGGGMYNSSSSPTLTNITFSGNYADSDGGGMYNNASSPALTNATFSDNDADYGGGMYNASSSPALMNITFSRNFAYSSGGGMYNDASSPTLTNVTFSGNYAILYYGGGMRNNTNSSPTLTNVTFHSNYATESGGGIYNCTNCRPPVRNTLFGQSLGGGNCGGDFAASSTTNMADDATCGSSTTQSANINLGSLGNYGGSTQTVPILAGSAAIDAGNPAYCPLTDQRGFGRFGQCDLGAFEAQGGQADLFLFLPLTLKNSRSYFEGPSESEDNDAYTSANGPLRSGRVYSGIFDDTKDYFSVYLDATGTISATATHTRTTVQMQLFYQVADVDHRLMIDFSGKHVEYTADVNHLGWYYIYLNAGPEPYLNEPYTLLVTYP